MTLSEIIYTKIPVEKFRKSDRWASMKHGAICAVMIAGLLLAAIGGVYAP